MESFRRISLIFTVHPYLQGSQVCIQAMNLGSGVQIAKLAVMQCE